MGTPSSGKGLQISSEYLRVLKSPKFKKPDSRKIRVIQYDNEIRYTKINSRISWMGFFQNNLIPDLKNEILCSIHGNMRNKGVQPIGY